MSKHQDFQNKLKEFLEAHEITTSNTDIFEHILLLNILPNSRLASLKCKFGGETPDTFYLNIDGLSTQEAEKFLESLKKIIQDENITLEYKTNPKKKDKNKSHYFTMNIDKAIELLIPHFKKNFLKLNSNMLAPYQEQSRPEFNKLQNQVNRFLKPYKSDVDLFIRFLFLHAFPDTAAIKLKEIYGDVTHHEGKALLKIGGMESQEADIFLANFKQIIASDNISMKYDFSNIKGTNEFCEFHHLKIDESQATCLITYFKTNFDKLSSTILACAQEEPSNQEDNFEIQSPDSPKLPSIIESNKAGITTLFSNIDIHSMSSHTLTETIEKPGF